MVDKRWFTSSKLVVLASLLLTLVISSACGTLDIDVEDPVNNPGPPAAEPTATKGPATATAKVSGAKEPAVAWYGSIHSVPGGGGLGDDYLKPWHLAIWPKFGRAVGLTGSDPAVNAEIERLRDQDIKATFWGDLTCNVADYGTCQLLVNRISPNDGGPQIEPDRVEGWQGRIGRLPVQPGSEEALLYFVLDGPVIALYGIASDDPAIQAELERLASETVSPEGGEAIRIWGELFSKAQPVTGTVIKVDRLETESS
jgi:hypothetical protein